MRARAGRLAAVRLSVALGLVLSATVAGQQPAQTPNAPTKPTQQPVFRAGANLVLVDAYPQKDGQIVEGLTPADFQILEDGKPQAVDSIEFVRVEPNQPEDARRDPNNLNEMKIQANDPHNRVFVIFLDPGHITITGSHDIRRPLVKALDQIIGPTDLFGITTPAFRPQDLTLGRRLLTVDEQLSKYWTWGAKDALTGDRQDSGEQDLTSCFRIKYVRTARGIEGVPWIISDGARKRFMDEVLIDRRREERALRALHDLADYMPTIREARTAMLVISNGWLLYRPDRVLQTELGSDARMESMMPGLPGDRPVGGAGPRPRPPDKGLNTQSQVSDVQWSACVTELNRLALLDDQVDFRNLLDLAARNNVAYYPVAADGLAPFDIGSAADGSAVNLDPRTNGGQTILQENFNRLRDRASSLRTAAENTGGIAVVDTNDLAKGLRRIVDDVSAYYLIGYYSTNTKFDGKFRRIDVKMTRPGLTVHARRGYLAPLPTPASTIARAADTPGSPSGAGAAATGSIAGAADVSTALESLGRLPATTDLYVHGSATATGVLAVVELPDRALMDAAWAQGADVTVDVTDDAGARVSSATGHIEAGTRGVIVRVPASATPTGTWHLTAKAKSGATSIDGRGDVARGSGKLIGDATLYRATPSPRSPLRPVADFLFRRNERLHVEWPVLQALDQRLARVLDRRGQPLPLAATLTEREVDGAPGIAVDLNLAPLAEGDYLIELTAGAGAETRRALVAFRIVR